MNFKDALKSAAKAVPSGEGVRRRLQSIRHTASDRLMRYRYPTVAKREFIRDLRGAIEARRAYAAGKIGFSQLHWMYYPMFLRNAPTPEEADRFEGALKTHCYQTGVFPDDRDFYLAFNRLYVDHLTDIDCLGISYRSWELETIQHYNLKGKLIYYPDQEPDRSSPSNDSKCYLQYFRNKRILLVSPFAKLLQARATRETFENVWSKTGKRWFFPANVAALEFPYGFASETRQRFATTVDLFRHITGEMKGESFDIALISAGALAIPLASAAKRMGKIGIDLGGHLQVLFGVLGERWRAREDWKRDYFNEHWIDMPATYRPKEVDLGKRDGSYW